MGNTVLLYRVSWVEVDSDWHEEEVRDRWFTNKKNAGNYYVEMVVRKQRGDPNIIQVYKPKKFNFELTKKGLCETLNKM